MSILNQFAHHDNCLHSPFGRNQRIYQIQRLRQLAPMALFLPQCLSSHDVGLSTNLHLPSLHQLYLTV